MLFVGAIIEQLASLAVELLPCPSPDVPVELHVGSIELLLARFQKCVQAINESGHFFVVEMAIVVVEIVEVGGLLVLRFVVTSLDAPDVSPMRGRGMVR